MMIIARLKLTIVFKIKIVIKMIDDEENDGDVSLKRPIRSAWRRQQ